MAGREAEPLESKQWRREMKILQELPTLKTLKDAGEPLLMGNDKYWYHVVSVMYHMPIKFQCRCHVIHHTAPQVYTKLIPFLELVL